jgi:hypothetical protein
MLYPCSPWRNSVPVRGDCRSSARPPRQLRQSLPLLSQRIKSLVCGRP